ncbi:AAA family ATPase [Variovorax terrae]|uniref:ATP-binding protein n=1 Tax=Variovorax terrae TaxID=2923278 RepID=A0A9X1VT91_9BURK|nr:ATP-binding protein [Variovorax terrae]MCJ0762912.1 ATP-binding protein [Variovorax terrae]
MQSSEPAPHAAAAATEPAVLHIVCGKIGSGKSTLAAHLATGPRTVLVSEDDWLSRLYPGEIQALPDYVRCAARLRSAMAGHLEALLRAGVSVVLDLPSNTPQSRQWARGVFESAGASHQLHFLDVPDGICKARLQARNASGLHPFQTTDAQFDEITRHFTPPLAQEGFHVIRHAPAERKG